ncbi:MAG: hypothetical protein P4L69_15660 [Desulfosporosinus sp.]|nr:hypothetical protein [Desulfosporosinus sp.]
MKTEVAGLTIPVSRIEHYVRDSTTRDRVSYATATAVSAAVGYVIEEFLNLAIEAMHGMKNKRITTRHLQHALANYPELAAVIPMESIGTGVVPHEVEEGEEKPKKRKKSHKRARSPKRGKTSTSRRRSKKWSASRKAYHKIGRGIDKLVDEIASRSRERSPAAKKARGAAFRKIAKASRSRRHLKPYKHAGERTKLIDEIVDVISSRSRSRSPQAKKVRKEAWRHIVALSKSRSRSRSARRTKGGRPSRRH